MTYFDSFQNRGIKYVEACVNFIRHKFFRLFNKTFYSTGILVVDNNTILGWLFYFGNHDGSFTAVVFVKLDHIFERKIAYHIAI